MLALACMSLQAAAFNVSGHITCEGAGVAGVAVSDGVVVTTTDASGYYSFTSEKKNGYVFYTVPRGYEPAYANGFNPQFWQQFKSTNTATAETHDFALTRSDNDKYIMIFGADSHLAKRNGDRTMYNNGWIAALKREKNAAQQSGTKIYSTILGDLTWDLYWYANKYNLVNFMADQVTYGYPIPLFPVMGNHDNDGAVKPLTDNTDLLASKPWRTFVCPNYYSFNLGRVHYIVLDDIFYTNSGTASGTGMAGGRGYLDQVTDEELSWLVKDLQLVTDKSTPIIVMFHIPQFHINSSFATYGAGRNYAALAACFNDFKTVHFMSGHTHYNYTAHPSYRNITEHNIAAICATWWWTGRLQNTNYAYNYCQDGSPAGYSYWTVDGDSLQWKYKSIASNGDAQMRIYDMNAVKNFMATEATAKALVKAYPGTVPTFGTYSDNAVLTNVFAYDTDWRVEVHEGVQYTLAANRLAAYDPLHVLAYDYYRYKSAGSITTTFATSTNYHMFLSQAHTSYLPITVKVTDSFGQVYYKTIQRPQSYVVTMDASQAPYDLGDVNGDGVVNVTDVTALINKILGNSPTGFNSIVADLNGDGAINVSDVTLLINKILGTAQ